MFRVNCIGGIRTSKSMKRLVQPRHRHSAAVPHTQKSDNERQLGTGSQNMDTSLVRPTLEYANAAWTPILRRDQILLRECSATSNEADTRATRQRLRGPATRTETTEPILPKSTWRHDRGRVKQNFW